MPRKRPRDKSKESYKADFLESIKKGKITELEHILDEYSRAYPGDDQQFLIDPIDDEGSRAAHVIVLSNNTPEFKIAAIKIIYAKLDNKPNIAMENNTSNTALSIACKLGLEKVVNFLLFKTVAFACDETSGDLTLLQCALEGGNFKIIESLLSYDKAIDREDGSDSLLEKQNYDGIGPLHYAVQQNNLKLVEFLLQNNAEINSKVKPLEILPENKRYIGMTPLHLAAEEGNVEICKFLISSGANLSAVAENGRLPIHVAIDSRKLKVLEVLKVLEILLQSGAAVNSKDNIGMTPLHLAAEEGDVEICKFLISSGANLSAVAENGWLPIHVAIDSRQLEVLEMLLQSGSAVNSKDNHGKAPINLVLKTSDNSSTVPQSCWDMFEQLIMHNAKLNQELFIDLKSFNHGIPTFRQILLAYAKAAISKGVDIRDLYDLWRNLNHKFILEVILQAYLESPINNTDKFSQASDFCFSILADTEATKESKVSVRSTLFTLYLTGNKEFTSKKKFLDLFQADQERSKDLTASKKLLESLPFIDDDRYDLCFELFTKIIKGFGVISKYQLLAYAKGLIKKFQFFDKNTKLLVFKFMTELNQFLLANEMQTKDHKALKVSEIFDDNPENDKENNASAINVVAKIKDELASLYANSGDHHNHMAAITLEDAKTLTKTIILDATVPELVKSKVAADLVELVLKQKVCSIDHTNAKYIEALEYSYYHKDSFSAIKALFHKNKSLDAWQKLVVNLLDYFDADSEFISDDSALFVREEIFNLSKCLLNRLFLLKAFRAGNFAFIKRLEVEEKINVSQIVREDSAFLETAFSSKKLDIVLYAFSKGAKIESNIWCNYKVFIENFKEKIKHVLIFRAVNEIKSLQENLAASPFMELFKQSGSFVIGLASERFDNIFSTDEVINANRVLSDLKLVDPEFRNVILKDAAKLAYPGKSVDLTSNNL